MAQYKLFFYIKKIPNTVAQLHTFSTDSFTDSKDGMKDFQDPVEDISEDEKGIR